MRLMIEDDFTAMSRTAANLLLAEMLRGGRVNLAITAGATPAKTYEFLIQEVRGRTHFDNVHYYNFDEIPVYDDRGFGLTMHELNTLYFEPAGILPDRIHVLDTSNDAGHDQRLADDGGLDAILLGIGSDGHFCGNLPGVVEFGDGTRRVDSKASAHLYEALLGAVGGDEAKVPEFYVTMGPKSVMQARHIILFASGASKAETIRKALQGPVTTDHPASVLQLHPHLTVVLDQDAAGALG